MKKRRSVEPIRKQRTIFYNSGETGERLPEFYMHVFPEDVSLAIMPIGGRTNRPGFKVAVSPVDNRAQAIIAAGLDRRQYANSLTEAVCDFFRTVSANLCFVDGVMFEVVYFEDIESKALTGFELVLINQRQLIKKGGQIYQRVPPDVAKEENVPELIFLPKEDLIEFKAPVAFEKALRDTRTNLSRLDKERLPGIALVATEKKIPYDFKAHERSMKLALVEAVKGIGWNARGSFNDCTTSYYWIRMMITFEKFKIELRRLMLAALNEGLQRIGNKLDFKSQIEISGLPLRVDVTDALRKLDLGEVPFTDVMKAFEFR